MNPFTTNLALQVVEHKYAHDLEERKEDWTEIAGRTGYYVMQSVGLDPTPYTNAIEKRIFMPGGRYLYATGREVHQTQNCLLLRAEDSREGWSDLQYKASMALMTGAGIGVVYSRVREENALIKGTGGLATGPVSLMNILNESGRRIMQGGSRRSAIWAGLHWWHGDIFKFIEAKNWSPTLRKLKEEDFNFPCPLDGTNISVILDDDFFEAFDDECHPQHAHAHAVYWKVIRQMLSTGEPGFSIDIGPNAGECLRNACTEITSYDDSDVCNIGSLVLSRIKSPEEMAYYTRLGTQFLMAGTRYSHLPYKKVHEVREKNRRIGLGVMGFHEWLVLNGKKYGPDAELERYMLEYAKSGEYANDFADKNEMSRPVKTRAIAPNGTIGIAAETTTSIEPIYSVALKRRYLKHNKWFYQYTIDPTAKRLIEEHGVAPESIEDAFSLAKQPERRIAFQAWVQKFVDHGISSTLNLPRWGSEHNNEDTVLSFGNMLYKYLPNLRGITCYPDGGRGGQPLTPVTYRTAMRHGAEEKAEDVCDLTKAGSCG